jgi:hypothetical protein
LWHGVGHPQERVALELAGREREAEYRGDPESLKLVVDRGVAVGA